LLDLLLAQARIGAGGAGLRAGVAFLQAADQRVVGVALYVRMGADHLLCMHPCLSSCVSKPVRSRRYRTPEAEDSFEATTSTKRVSIAL
jgi:hypothetical protein